MKSNSFTLIELLVTISVIGLLSSIVLVNLRGTRQQAQLSKALEFSQSIQNALGSEAVGIWRFEDDVLDSSGYNNHGTIHGATYTDGIVGRALSFDGDDDYVTVSWDSSLYIAQNDHTISGWVYINNLSEGAGVAMINNRSAYSNHESSICVSNNTLRYTRGDGAGNSESIYLSPVPPTNEWFHFAVVRFGMTVQWYLNGASQNSESLTITDDIVMNDQNPYLFGRMATTWGPNSLDGKIDEICVYNTALSVSEIQQLYVEGLERYTNLTINN